MWFINAILATLLWGAADLFYKISADENDRYSHLKTSMVVGLVMGLHAIFTLIFTNIDYNFKNIVVYLPVSAMYILSMTVGYLGLRYLELSVSSPIQNSSGAFTCILCLIFLGQKMNIPTAVAVILICVGVFLLGAFEKKRIPLKEEGKYARGFVAVLFPIAYCVIDSLGTFFDAYYLDDFTTTPLLNVTEDNIETVANISYELTFLICAVILFVFICFIKKEHIAIKGQKSRAIAAVFETAGQLTYVYAMSGNAVVSAPLIASYSIISVILSRIFLKEKLLKRQYAAVAAVMLGIVILGVLEGISE